MFVFNVKRADSEEEENLSGLNKIEYYFDAKLNDTEIFDSYNYICFVMYVLYSFLLYIHVISRHC